MTEYDPHQDEHDDLAQPADVPDQLADDGRFDPAPLPPLDDLAAAPSDELHFPGDDPDLDTAPPDDRDPAAPWPDDDRFSDWLAGAQDAAETDDPAADAQLREQLAAPSEELPSSDALVDWTLRRIDQGEG